MEMNTFSRNNKKLFFFLFIVLITAGALLRLYYCFLPPLYTTDLLRNLGFGVAFWEWGFKVYDLTAFDLSPLASQFLWPNHHYTYPAVTLLFFALLSGIWPSVIFGKLVFTGFDAVNSWLMYKATGDRWIAVLYWLNPISVWYTSREGQFESFVVFWMVLSLLLLYKKKPWAFGCLSLAIQTKLFPVFLVPYFMSRMSWKNPKRLLREIGWGAAGFIPSLVAVFQCDYLMLFLEPGYIPRYNPISWTLGDPALYPFFPYWIILAHWVAGILFLAACLYGLKKTGKLAEISSPLLFVLAVKASRIGQFWYLMLTPAFCLTVQDNTVRRWLFAFAFLLGFRSLYSILIGPIGYQNPPDAVYLLGKVMWGW